VLLGCVLLPVLKQAHGGDGGEVEVLLNLSMGGVGDGVASQGLGVYNRCVHSDLL
jgi:hypothetical protein